MPEAIGNTNSVSSSFNSSNPINSYQSNDDKANNNKDIFIQLEKKSDSSIQIAENGREANKRFEEELTKILG